MVKLAMELFGYICSVFSLSKSLKLVNFIRFRIPKTYAALHTQLNIIHI